MTTDHEHDHGHDRDHDGLRDLVAASAFDAVTPAEKETVARHLDGCAECAAEAERLRETVRLLDVPPGEGAGWEPPPSRGPMVEAEPDHVVAGLFRGRRPQWESPRPAATPVAAHAAAYAGSVASLTALLPHVYGRWGYDRWKVPVVHDWDVQSTLAHLVAADEQLALALGVDAQVPPSPAEDGEPWGAYWDRRTADVIRHERRHSPERTRAAWAAQCAALLATPEAHDPERAARAVELMGMRLPVADHFTVRAFETWIHTDDIGRALGIPVPPPPAAHLERLVRLAVSVLGQALGPAVPPVRFTLTGIDEWTLGAGTGPVRAGLVLDPVDFCFLAGGRSAPDAVPHTATGDAAAVRDVLERTASLAWL
ncbi:maleylpyruvate isomerase family mycothiol-dependent enzyme [Streptomyces sp. NPDC096132]|uniref:maleylpyruvate isomerase family mycothiol-dependent enzyme n=1 Tax=Streptomyces sp. NPDC096132 TaxID=3366075 RepID=UPI003820C13A